MHNSKQDNGISVAVRSPGPLEEVSCPGKYRDEIPFVKPAPIELETAAAAAKKDKKGGKKETAAA
ncbi:hypothetical protein CpipJ_CPIJ019521 [Culex quinquefasciatus]|uniref:Uncharacterized protein n=1 Tax=Culex quinquefasciatus TaxID=7176 RepID=B0XJQ5_CULQU|nr:hypothetical protein CpipJ_CPIJ019521 [Culex quinquefasciatus]|eukprot:XP_001869877.1 hypothetical protein CpipJ_CPIJ019521 [Culex quinquefasciatus]